MNDFKGPVEPITIQAKGYFFLHNFQRIIKKIWIEKKIINGPYFLNSYFKNSFFYPSAKLTSLYGCGNWIIGKNSLIGASLICERPSAKIIIGDNTFISSGTQLISSSQISIADHVLIARDVVIQDSNSHSTNFMDRRVDIDFTLARFFGKPRKDKNWDVVKSKEIYIADDVWIGMRCLILKGVSIGKNSIVAAGSVVTRNVPANVIVAGNPAVVIKQL